MGMYFIGNLVKKTGRTSYFLLSLLILIVISAIILPAEGILQMIEREKAGFDVFKFQSLCP